MISRKPRIAILKPRTVIDKSRTMDDYPRFLVYPVIVIYKLPF